MRSSFVLLSFALSTLAKPLSKRWSDVSEKHSWSDVPQGWVLQKAAPSDYKMELRIGLKSHRMSELIDTLQKVSDPNHESYGEHLTAEQVNELIAPHSNSLDLVDEWLVHHGIDLTSTSRSSAKDWITVTVTVAQAEKMLDTTYNVFHHPESSDSVVRTMAYNLPSILHDHVDVVSPTTYMGTTRSITKKTDADLQARSLFETRGNVDWTCGLFPNAGCLRELYNTVGYTANASAPNSIGVVGFEDQYASHSDLKTFFEKYRPDVKGVADFTTIRVNGGGDDQSNPGIEANLDMQYAQAIAYPVKHVYYSVKGTPPYIPDDYESQNKNDPYLDFLDFILTQNDVPQVITTSYSNEEQTVPRDYAQKVCDGFAQLGARGISIMFSSGDNGVGAGFCHSNDGSKTTRFQPKFPPSCPWVTAVGGTTNVSPEKAVDLGGGGFSNYFTRPDYQNDAVASYAGLLGTKYDGMYNKTGRGYPDVAAQAWGTPVVINGFTLPAGGTSVSVPTVAGVIALLNDYRLSIGKKPLGFLNPWLYSLGKAGFNDITTGHNPGCGTDGFSALKGWDPATGWGTPDFLKLKALM